MKNKILICGMGQGGHAIAVHSARKGNEVSLYTHTPKKAEIIKNNGLRIKATGLIEDEVQISNITTDLEGAVKDQDYIFIVTDATVHKHYADRIAPYLSNQNIILISPGIGGAMEFMHEVKKKNQECDISVSETDTLVYACKVPEIGHSYIKSEKNSIIYSTVSSKEKNIDDFIQELYPQFKNTKNPLMGLDDSPVFHIVSMIKNSDRILNREDFNFYIDGILPEYAEYMVEMDKERCEVAKAVGIEPRTVREWLNIAYGVKEDTLYNMIQNTPPYQNTPEISNRSPAPKTLYHRYLLEEVPLRAVPTVMIGKMYGVSTPKYEEMINSASNLMGINFWKSGRTLNDMGLTEKDIKEWSSKYSWF